MKYKKYLILISMLICILFMISSVSAADVEVDMNQTLGSDESQVELEQVSQESDSDQQLTAQNDGNVLGATSEIYFNANAAFDGDGSKAKPYKKYTSDRIKFGSTVYFADGTYNVESTLVISSSLNYKTTFIGQGNNVVLKSPSSIMGFKIRDGSNLILQNLILDGVRVNNNGNFQADNVIFRNCNSRYSAVYSIESNVKSTFKFTNCNFKDNYASELAGAIAVYNGQVDIKNCNFNNVKSNTFGGAIDIHDATLNIINSKFDSSYSNHGGVLYASHGNIKITGSTFDNSKSEIFGGVIACEYTDLKVDNCNFTNYQSVNDGGGALYLVNSNSNVTNSLFYNGSSNFGGAICNLRSNLSVSSSKFIKNYAGYYGGSIYNMYGKLVLIGNTFHDSKAKSCGGAIIARYSDSVDLDYNNFVETFAPSGPVLFDDGDEESIHHIENNVYNYIYELVAVYTGTLNGNEVKVRSNYLTFSISNNGTFIAAHADKSVQNSEYINFNIVCEGSDLINTPLDKNDLILFNILKKNNNLKNKNIEIFLIDEAGNNISFKTINIDDKDYTDENLFSINFTSYLLNLEYDNFYSHHESTSVPSLIFVSQEEPVTIPSSYDSRDYGYITPVKNQGSGGNCWAFGGLATLEACLKKATGITFDFSEENVKNLMAEFSGFDWNTGGYDQLLWGYLTGWFGPIYDMYDRYDEHSALSVLYNPALHIQNILTISKNDTDAIKKAIMKYGAVTMTVDWNAVTGEKHTMSIVGWDNNYRGSDHFGARSNGAWIVKNSYGPNWENNGYLYISYSPQRIYDLYTFVFSSDTPEYSDIYQYDYGGLTGYYSFGNLAVYYKNKFISRSNDILSAASTYFEKDTDYILNVYINGKLNTTQNGKAFAGYNIIPLNNEIKLSKGDVFEIEFGSNSIPYYKSSYNDKEIFSEGLSYYKISSSYLDFYIYNSKKPMVICIKAFTRPAELKDIEISFNQLPINIKINDVIPVSVNIPKGLEGVITYTIDGVTHYAPAKDGLALFNLSFNRLSTKTLTVQYKSSMEKSNIISHTFNVVYNIPDNITISADNVVKYYGGSEKFTAKVTNNMLPVIGETVTVIVNGKTYTQKTDSLGGISLDLNLDPGIYYVLTSYKSKVFTSKFTVVSTIIASDFNGEYKNTKVNASFLDTNGNNLSSGRAIFKVDGKEFIGNIMGNGTAEVILNSIGAGEHVITIINPINNEKIERKLSISKINPPNYTLSFYQDGYIVKIYADLPSDAEGFVTLTCENKDAFSQTNETEELDNKKFVMLELNKLDVGNHILKAFYAGDDNYNSALREFEFTVKETNIVITESNPAFYYFGNPENKYYVTVTNNGEPVSRPVDIIFTTMGFTAKISSSDGNPYTNINVNKPGEYPVIIQYGGVNITRTIVVKPTIVCDASLNYDYSQSVITATFLDTNGNPLKNRAINFQLEFDYYTVYTDENGRISKAVALPVGTYDLNLVNPVNNEELDAKVKINKYTPNLNCILRENYDSYVLSSALSPLASGGSLIYSFNGQTSKINYNNGFSDYVMYTTRSDNYKVEVSFTGDSNLNPVSRAYTYYMNNKADAIYANAVTVGYGQNKYVSISLVDCHGNVKPYSRLTVVVDGKKSYLTTNAYGKVNYRVNLNVGTHYLQLSSNNNGYKSVKVVVKKSTPILKASNAKFKVKLKNKKLKVNFYVPAFKLNHYKLTIKVNGKTYTAYTNAKGQATFNINKLTKKGKFKAVITYKGDRNLNKITRSVKITVK